MGAGGAPRGTGFCHDVASADDIADFDGDCGVVRITSNKTASVVNFNGDAISGALSGIDDEATTTGVHGGTNRGGKVNSAVEGGRTGEGIATVAESGAYTGTWDRDVTGEKHVARVERNDEAVNILHNKIETVNAVTHIFEMSAE